MSNKIKCRWYVYRLVDPRDSQPFYVGKGSGNRIDAHEQEALKWVCHEKCLVINEIWSENLQVIKEKVAYFWDEQAAYDYEHELIQEIGIENLTNIVDYPQSAKSGFYSRERPFTPAMAMHRIRKMTWLFAMWLRNRDKTPVLEGNLNKHWLNIYNAGFRIFWSGVAEKALNTAASDKSHHDEIISLLRPFNIEISFDGGNHGC